MRSVYLIAINNGVDEGEPIFGQNVSCDCNKCVLAKNVYFMWFSNIKHKLGVLIPGSLASMAFCGKLVEGIALHDSRVGNISVSRQDGAKNQDR